MQEIDYFAPVIIPTLCRYEHFKRCVESLSRCTHADKTELYIGLDYPANESHWDGYKKIKEFIPTIKGFANVIVLERNENYGASKNIRELRQVVLRKYDREIFTEDDNEFAPNFLDYINKGLCKYKDNPHVYTISGYNYPVDMSEYHKNCYAFYGFSAWGVGIWHTKRYKSWDEEDVKAILKFPKKIWRIWKVEPRILQSLTGMIQRHSMGDTLDVAKCILEDKVSIYPTVTLVKNYGHDGTGVHCSNSEDDIYLEQKLDDSLIFDFDEIELKSIDYKPLKEFFSIGVKAKLSTLKRIFLWELKF